MHRASIGALVVALALQSPLAQAQSPETPAGNSAFEVASVRPNKSGVLQQFGARAEGDHLTATNVSLRQLIQSAYNLGTNRLVGGPSRIGSDRFDITAKAETPISGNEWRPMLRTLLTVRFKLAIHTETRQTKVLALVKARSDVRLGPNLRPAKSDCAPSAKKLAAQTLVA
jgi:uncharacterized protein (TIGR03435 family)